MRKKTHFLWKNKHKIKTVLFFVYCIFIIYYALLSRTVGDEHTADLRLMWAYREMMTGNPEWKEDVCYNIENILFFIPYGAMFPEALKIRMPLVLKKNRWMLILFTGMLSSFLIETIQYVFCLGLCELDDVLCNSVGALIGCFFNKALKKIKFAEKFFKGWDE